MADYKVTVGVDIQSKGLDALEKRLEAFDKKTYTANVNVNSGSISKGFDDATKNIDKSSDKMDKALKKKTDKLMAKQAEINRLKGEYLNAGRKQRSSDWGEQQLREIARVEKEYADMYNSMSKKEKKMANARINAARDSQKSKIASSNREIQSQKNELNGILKNIEKLDKTRLTEGKGSKSDVARNARKQLDYYQSERDRILGSLKGSFTSAETGRYFERVKQSDANIASVKAKISQLEKDAVVDIKARIDDSSFKSAQSKITTKLSQLQTHGKTPIDNNALASVNSMKQAYTELDDVMSKYQRGLTTEQDVLKAYDKYDNATKSAKNLVNVQQDLTRQSQQLQKIQSKGNKLFADMETFANRNSRAMRKYGTEFNTYKRELKDAIAINDIDKINDVQSKYNKLVADANRDGLTQATYMQQTMKKIGSLASYYTVSSVMFGAMAAAADAFRNVVQVDTAMTELMRVTDLTTTDYSKVYDGLTKSAKEYGATLSDMISSTADWVKQGFSTQDATGLAEVSSMYQHIGDITKQEANENLITAYNGYKEELLNLYDGDAVAAVGYAGDVYNEIGNNFAITSGQVGDGMTRAASALSFAGNTFQEAAGMITGVTEVTQDPTKAGTAMKILSLRLRGMKGELEEVESGASEGVESISKMQTQVMNMTGGKVNIFDDTGSFKSTYDIMQGIVEVWDELSSVDQANLLETIAGKNRANDVAALIDNWERVEEATEAAYGAEGSASKEHEKYLDSIQGRITTLQATWQTLSNTLVNSDFAKGAIGGFTGILDVLNTIIDTVGMMPLLMGIGGLMTKGFGLVEFNKQTGKFETAIGHLRKSMSDAKFSFPKGFAESVKQNRIALNGLVRDFNKSGNWTDAYNKNMLNANEATQKIANSMRLLDVTSATTASQKKVYKDYNAQQLRNAQRLVETRMQLGQLQSVAAKGTNSLNPSHWKNLSKLVDFYNNGLKNTNVTQTQFISTVGAMDSNLSKYFSTVSAGQASLTGLIAKTAAARVGMMALGAAATLAGTAMSMGAMFIVSAAFSKISEWYVSEKELAQKVDDIVTEFENQKDAIKSANDVLNESGLRYAELSKGVSRFGSNLSLTSDEYQEYLDLSNQIAEHFPELISGYDAEGNAILAYTGKIETLTDALKEMRKEAYQDVLDGGKDIFKDFQNSEDELPLYTDTKNTLEELLDSNDIAATLESHKLTAEEMSEALEKTTSYGVTSQQGLQDMADEYFKTMDGSGQAMLENYSKDDSLVGDTLDGVLEKNDAHALIQENEEQAKAYNESLTQLANVFKDNGLEKEWLETNEEFVERVMTENKSKAEEILTSYEETESQITEGMQSLAEAHIGKKLLDEDYEGMSDSTKRLLTAIVPEMDAEFFSQFDTVEDMYGYLTNVVKQFDSLSNEQQKSFEVAFELEAKVNDGEIDVGEYIEGVNNFQETLSSLSLPDEVKEQIKLALGFDDDIDSIQYDFNRLKKELVSDELGMSADMAEGFAQELSSAELTAVLDLIVEGQIDKEMIDEYEQEFSKLKALSNVTGLAPFTEQFGNVDLSNADRVIEWNEENLEKYRSQLMSWNEMNEDGKKLNWQDVKGMYKGSVSTVEGGSKTIEGMDIAYTPYLETEDGLELLSKDTVDTYIDSIFKMAKEDDGKVDAGELLSFDMVGLEIDGKRINNLIAGVGRNAIEISHMMHYAGENGALSMTELMQTIEREAKVQQALTYEIDIEAETTGIESVKTALTETMGATGAAETSVAALTSRFAGLSSSGKTATDLFEATATGLRMNTDVFYELEDALATQQLDETTGHLEAMKEELARVEGIISDTSSTAENVSWAIGRRDELLTHMNLLGQQAALYEGLTNKYAEWQRAEEAGNNRDMYESVLTGHDTVKDELSRGWADDGTIKYLELLTGRTDLAGKTLQEVRGVFKGLDKDINSAGYSINDFFTVDSEGNSTSEGVWNFLDTINAEGGKIGKAVTKHKDGSYTFDFEVAGGDEAIAEALGISEELVDIMLSAAKDAGFEVNFEGAYEEYAKIVSSAEEAQKAFNKINKSTADNVNFDFGTSDLDKVKEDLAVAEGQLERYKRFTNKKGDEYIKRNKQGEVIDQNGNVLEGGKEMLEMASTLQTTKDRLSDPVYMSIDASTLSDELQEPTEKLQEYDRLLAQRNQLELRGHTAGKAYEENAKAMKETYEYFKKIRDDGGDLAENLGIDDMSNKELQTALDNQTLTIPTELELTASIDDTLQDMLDIMKIERGLIDPVEVPWYFEERTGAKIEGIDFSKYDDATIDVVTTFVTDEQELLNALNGKGRQIVVDFYISNPEVWDEYSDDEKEILIKFVDNNNSVLSKYSEEDQQKLIEFRLANPDAFNNFLSLSEGQREIVFNAILQNPDFLDGFDASQHDVLINFIANNPDFFTKYDDPVEQQIVLDYIAQNGEEAWNELGEDGQQKYIKANLKMVPESTEQAKEDVKQATKEGASEGTSQGVVEGASQGAKGGKEIGSQSGSGVSSKNGVGVIDFKANTTDMGSAFTGTGTVEMNSEETDMGNNFTGSGTANMTPNETDMGDGFTGDGIANMAPDKTDFGGVFGGDGTANMSPDETNMGDGFTGTGTANMNPDETNFGGIFSGNGTAFMGPNTLYMGGFFSGDGTANMNPNKTNFGGVFGGSGTANMSPNKYNMGSNFFGTGIAWLTGKIKGGAKVDGTAHAKGTAFADGSSNTQGKGFDNDVRRAEQKRNKKIRRLEVSKSDKSIDGKAFEQGNWGTKNSGVALGGELGQELVVRDGHFFTIGDDSAEFFSYKKDDIIFNAEQTKQIFAKGRITHGKKRGNALASGSAFAGGTVSSSGRAFAPGSHGGGGGRPTFGDSTSKSSSGTGSSGSNKSSNNKSNNKDTKSTKDDTKEVFDWIEVAIDRIERLIERLGKTADSVYKTWAQRNKALTQSINKTRKEIDLQWQGYNRYMKQANGVTISKNKKTDAKYKQLVQNGKIDIETIKNEKLAEKIKEYQEWYEKALDCKDAIDELGESLAELYTQKFDLVVTKYESQLTRLEHKTSMLEERISQSEERGQVVNTSYYDALIKNEQNEQAKLIKQREEMKAAMNDAMNSGTLAKYSEEWYRQIEEINGVTLAIEESKTSVLEYQKSIREIEWEKFDLLQDKISDITTETEFLIELMSNKELYNEDTGQLTNEGMATMGLHAENYSVHMEKAAMYQSQIAELNEQIAKDPKNQELIERRREMIEAQQDSIAAAEAEKNAIRDMVEEGINLELDALQERIDKYNEALQSQKD